MANSDNTVCILALTVIELIEVIETGKYYFYFEVDVRANRKSSVCF